MVVFMALLSCDLKTLGNLNNISQEQVKDGF